MAETEEKTETTEEKPKRGPGRPKKKEPTNSEKLLGLVQELLHAVTAKVVKINHEEQAAGVDLGAVGGPTGTRFRQLFVKADAGFIAVRLIEGFKPAHGGAEQRKTLYAMSVPVHEKEAYDLLQRRFFGYSLQTNVEQGVVLLDMVKETLAKSE